MDRVKLFIIYSLLAILFQQSGWGQNTWEAKASLPNNRYRGVAFAIGDYGYIGTGSTGGGMDNIFWRYDPLYDSWTEFDSMPGLPRRGAICFTIANCAYIGGGINSSLLPDYTFWEYDPEQLKWTQKADIPHLSQSDSDMTAFSIDGKGFLLISYWNPNFFMYDPTINTWVAKKKFPGLGRLNQVGFSIGGKGYIGSGSPAGTNSEFWEYDPAKDEWTESANIPGEPSRSTAVGFSIAGCGYVGLGLAKGAKILDDFWEYHPETDSWSQIANCGFASSNALGFSIGSKGYVGTGLIYSSGPNFWEYTPNFNTVITTVESEIIRIYPNPTKGILYIDSNVQEILSYSIYSSSGQIVESGIVTDGTILVENIPAGMYFILFSSGKRSWNKKLLIE